MIKAAASITTTDGMNIRKSIDLKIFANTTHLVSYCLNKVRCNFHANFFSESAEGKLLYYTFLISICIRRNFIVEGYCFRIKNSRIRCVTSVSLHYVRMSYPIRNQKAEITAGSYKYGLSRDWHASCCISSVDIFSASRESEKRG